MIDESVDEMVTKTILQQEAKVRAYDLLKERDLPIPRDLKEEVEAHRRMDRE